MLRRRVLDLRELDDFVDIHPRFSRLKTTALALANDINNNDDEKYMKQPCPFGAYPTPTLTGPLLGLVIRLHRQTSRVGTARIKRMERKVDLAHESLDMPGRENISNQLEKTRHTCIAGGKGRKTHPTNPSKSAVTHPPQICSTANALYSGSSICLTLKIFPSIFSIR